MGTRHWPDDAVKAYEKLEKQLAARDAALDLALIYINRKACIGMGHEYVLAFGDFSARQILEEIDKELEK